jgi:hypothetical protein
VTGKKKKSFAKKTLYTIIIQPHQQPPQSPITRAFLTRKDAINSQLHCSLKIPISHFVDHKLLFFENRKQINFVQHVLRPLPCLFSKH